MAAPRAVKRKPRQETQLHAADDFAVEHCDGLHLIGIVSDGPKCRKVTSVDSSLWVFTSFAQHIVGQEVDNGGQIIFGCFAERRFSHPWVVPHRCAPSAQRVVRTPAEPLLQ